MKNKRLTRSFYIRPAITVAKDLLGKYIIRKIGKITLSGKIIETEAYVGPKDRASHAYNGKRTKRNEAEFLEGGYIYIYLVYGMYWQLNITTDGADKPECVLIRAVEPIIQNDKISNLSARGEVRQERQFPVSRRIPKSKISKTKQIKKLTDGPGKLCRWMKLDKSFYAEDLARSKRIWLEDRGDRIQPSSAKSTARIGIDYAGPYWSKRKWRFVLSH